MKTYKPDPNPLRPPEWHEHIQEVIALQALAEGKADEGQQALALRFIVECLAATYDMPFRPDSARASDFASGKMWVGQQIVAALKSKTGVLQKAAEEQKPKPKRKSNG